MTQPILITGGAGFIGCNLADRLAANGHNLLIYDCLSRAGVEANLGWLQRRHGRAIQFIRADIRDMNNLCDAVRASKAIFHFAAQVAVTTSLDNPRLDFETNLRGTFDLLETIRRDNPVPVIMASTNKVYGDLAHVPLRRTGQSYVPAPHSFREFGVNETCPLDFHTPYGCSKGAADQYVLDAARSFALKSAVLRMSCIYGPRQMGTEDQGWVAHFLIRALAGRPIHLYGDGFQVRDILHVKDAVDAYVAALEHIDTISGQAYNLGGGQDNAVSLLDLLDEIEELVGQKLEIKRAPWRQGDQRWYVSDRRKIDRTLHLPRPMNWREGLRDLLNWLQRARHEGKERFAGALP